MSVDKREKEKKIDSRERKRGRERETVKSMEEYILNEVLSSIENTRSKFTLSTNLVSNRFSFFFLAQYNRIRFLFSILDFRLRIFPCYSRGSRDNKNE